MRNLLGQHPKEDHCGEAPFSSFSRYLLLPGWMIWNGHSRVPTHYQATMWHTQCSYLQN